MERVVVPPAGEFSNFLFFGPKKYVTLKFLLHNLTCQLPASDEEQVAEPIACSYTVGFKKVPCQTTYRSPSPW
mgnify:CR=1 FL=1